MPTVTDVPQVTTRSTFSSLASRRQFGFVPFGIPDNKINTNPFFPKIVLKSFTCFLATTPGRYVDAERPILLA